MAKPTLIFDTKTFPHFVELHRALRAVELRQYITKTQGDEIAHAIDERFSFPANVALAQRTPKGTVYVYLNDTLAFLIDQRGAFSWPSATHKGKPQAKTA